MTKMATTRPAGLNSAQLAAALQIDRSQSDLVSIDDAQVKRMADHIRARLDTSGFERARWDDPLFWNVEADDERRAQYFAIGSAINFRFWELTNGRLVRTGGRIDREHYGGAMYMWRCMRRAEQRQNIDLLNARVLANLSGRDFDTIFSDDEGRNPLAVARDDRVANLRDLGGRSPGYRDISTLPAASTWSAAAVAP